MERNYWQEAILMVWGASVRLLAQNKTLQEKVKKIQASGVKVCACVACVSEYGVKDIYDCMNIEIVHTGVVMTDCLKDGWRTITI